MTAPPNRLTVATYREDRAIVLALSGELDLATVTLVRDTLKDVASDSAERLVIDLGGLSFIDSSGLRLLVEEHRRLADRGHPVLEIRPGSRAVQRIFQITRLDEVLPFREASTPGPDGRA